MNRRAGRPLSVISALAMGCATGILAIGGCGGAPWPSNGKLPERVVDKLEDCGRKGPTPLQETNYELTFTVHVAEDETEARVDDVMLTGSTLHIDDVEACMRDALYGMRTPLEALALRRRTLSPDPPLAPDTRALLGQSETVLFLQVAALFVLGYATYHVIVHVLLDKPRPKRRPHPATSATEEPPAPAPVASATAEPTATTVPTAVPAPAAKSCTDMYVDCREKGPPCDRKLGGKTMCAYCQDNCLAEEPYKSNNARSAGSNDHEQYS